ncbi:hypothetical protein HMPREF9570_00198 [Cutibacterium acnes HL043PA1]|nr:hypothetical protein HMPREF9570_00198 [Cutibacterium acnes HL043PA1]
MTRRDGRWSKTGLGQKTEKILKGRSRSFNSAIVTTMALGEGTNARTDVRASGPHRLIP